MEAAFAKKLSLLALTLQDCLLFMLLHHKNFFVIFNPQHGYHEEDALSEERCESCRAVLVKD